MERHRSPTEKSRLRWLIYAMLAVVYVWAFSGIPFSGIKETAGQVTKAIFSGLLSPDWDFVYLPGGEDLREACSIRWLYPFWGRSYRRSSVSRSLSGPRPT